MTDVSGTAQVGLSWADGTPVNDGGGTSTGFLDVLNTTLPSYSTRLDAVALNLKTVVNTQHAAGYDLHDNAGGEFFAGNGAGDIRVAFTDPTLLAVASTKGTLDSTNADLLAKLGTAAGGPDTQYRQLVVDLGVQAQSVNRRVDVQASVTSDIDDARDSSAGVNIDEEMMNMLTFQRAYEAASRVLTSVDQMLDTLINHTGLVGR
jgi:flagellar hook-associated protein 1